MISYWVSFFSNVLTQGLLVVFPFLNHFFFLVNQQLRRCHNCVQTKRRNVYIELWQVACIIATVIRMNHIIVVSALVYFFWGVGIINANKHPPATWGCFWWIHPLPLTSNSPVKSTDMRIWHMLYWRRPDSSTTIREWNTGCFRVYYGYNSDTCQEGAGKNSRQFRKIFGQQDSEQNVATCPRISARHHHLQIVHPNELILFVQSKSARCGMTNTSGAPNKHIQTERSRLQSWRCPSVPMTSIVCTCMTFKTSGNFLFCMMHCNPPSPSVVLAADASFSTANVFNCAHAMPPFLTNHIRLYVVKQLRQGVD